MSRLTTRSPPGAVRWWPPAPSAPYALQTLCVNTCTCGVWWCGVCVCVCVCLAAEGGVPAVVYWGGVSCSARLRKEKEPPISSAAPAKEDNPDLRQPLDAFASLRAAHGVPLRVKGLGEKWSRLASLSLSLTWRIAALQVLIVLGRQELGLCRRAWP